MCKYRHPRCDTRTRLNMACTCTRSPHSTPTHSPSFQQPTRDQNGSAAAQKKGRRVLFPPTATRLSHMTEHATQNAVHRRSDRGAVGVGATDPTTDVARRRVRHTEPSRTGDGILDGSRNVASRSRTQQNTAPSSVASGKHVRRRVGITDGTSKFLRPLPATRDVRCIEVEPSGCAVGGCGDLKNGSRRKPESKKARTTFFLCW